MPRPELEFDWETLVDEPAGEPPEDTRRRLRLVLALLAAALAIILARAAELEFSDGENFRRVAVKPLERSVATAANRGSILARDGTPLAADRKAKALAIQFYYLAAPPDPAWVRRMARARLSRTQRRRAERVAAMEETIREELSAWQRRLAELCKLSDAEWLARCGRIQRRVTKLAAHVNARRLEQFDQRNAAELAAGELSAAAIVAGLFAPPERLPPPPVVLAEQTAYHRVFDNLSSETISEIEHHPERYPGAKIIEYTRREYPGGSLAANVLGHVGPGDDTEATLVASERFQTVDLRVGVMGAEHRFESILRGQGGLETHFTDHRGNVLRVERNHPGRTGHDVVLSIDAALQLSAEQLLDRALRRRQRQSLTPDEPRHGGAVVVLDVHSGEILAAASAPRFDPNWFAWGDPRVEATLQDPEQPLFDRVAKMAIAPGSAFKPVTALALVERSVVDPRETFHCQGYLEDPDRLRCQIFRQQGIGHGDVTLADALAQSCNVYFFHHATALGGAPLADWATRLGFGRPTGIELADEAAGQLPTPAQLRTSGQTQALAIGQGTLTATPLQVARAYAAIANGGYLVTPRLTRDRTDVPTAQHRDTTIAKLSESTRVAGLKRASLDAVHEGLRRVVDDPNGTAFHSVRLSSIAIAGKTGTAETGAEGQDHAWFAGYVPADAPRYAFVVVLEHGGSGATAAGALARGLVERMQQLGCFGAKVEPPIPPGNG